MKKKIAVLMLCALCVGGCGKVPTLKNGQEAVVTIDGGGISAEDLYTELKDSMGLQALITLIDTQVLEKEYKGELKAATTNAESTIKNYIDSYGSEKDFLTALQYYTNYSTIDAYKEYLYLSYLQNLAIEDYAKTQISDKEIKKYYNDKIVGDIEVSHILITPKVTDDMKEDEKTKAENEALDKANEVIGKLKEAKNVKDTFKELAKEYSDDAATKNKGGSLGAINKDTLGATYDEFVAAAYKLKDGKYTTTAVKTSLGYHIILRTKTNEKAKLDDVKDSIQKTLATELMNTDQTISIKGLQELRKKYNVEIKDPELKTQYANYIQNGLSELEKK